MKVRCRPGPPLRGTVSAIPSKSSLHRLLFCAGLAEGKSSVSPIHDSQDIRATLNVLSYLGVSAEIAGEGFDLESSGPRAMGGEVDVIESGSTLRFAIPLILAAGAPGAATVLRGREGLARRPLGIYETLFAGRGARLERLGGDALPLRLSGRLAAGEYRLRGDVSSQFVSGLLFALPLLDGESRIVLETPLQSAAYAAMTVETLKRFGVSAKPGGGADFPFGGWIVAGNQKYLPGKYLAETDWSGAAFWIAADDISRAKGGQVEVRGLDPESLQPDKRIADIVRQGPNEVDVRDCPDLLPVLAAWAGLSGRPLRIRGAARVRIKECDRVAAMARELNAIGGRVRELPDGLDVEPVASYAGGRVSGWNDHRVVMALAIASLGCREDLLIEGAEAVEKSYPSFFEDFRSLGGFADVE